MNDSKKVKKAPKPKAAPKAYHVNDTRNKARNVARDARLKAAAAEKFVKRVVNSPNVSYTMYQKAMRVAMARGIEVNVKEVTA